LKLGLAKLAVEGFPGVGGYMRRECLAIGSGPPLLQAIQVHKLHATRALARRQKWVLFGAFILKTNPAD